MKAISLFTGAGGMDVGFRNAGFEIIWANDIDKDACNTYRKNHGPHIKHGNLDDLIPELEQIGKDQTIDCLFGGPPCQGFSVAGKMDINDPRSKLVWSYMEAVRKVKPKIFVMENVKALAELEKFRAVREGLYKIATEMGYAVELLVLNAKDYGVPQNRERMFLVGIKGNRNNFKDIIELEKTKAPNLREALSRVGKIGTPNNNRICKAKVTTASSPILRKSPYAGMLFNGQGRPLNLDGHAATLPASMGGNRTPIIDDDALYENKKPWVEEYHENLMNGGIPINPKSIPSRLRRLTVDEAIAIQTFPREYIFTGTQSSIYKQIGNAVPCMLAAAVARAAIKSYEPNEPPKKEDDNKQNELNLVF